MAKCKSCGADIIWIKTLAGKAMPCDAEAVAYWKDTKGKATVITPNGETVKATLEVQRMQATGKGYIPHWATCPKAANFRRAK